MHWSQGSLMDLESHLSTYLSIYKQVGTEKADMEIPSVASDNLYFKA